MDLLSASCIFWFGFKRVIVVGCSCFTIQPGRKNTRRRRPFVVVPVIWGVYLDKRDSLQHGNSWGSFYVVGASAFYGLDVTPFYSPIDLFQVHFCYTYVDQP
ncbi:unnamed protein product [Ectocarpus sp. 6 AP-2014]